MRPLHLAMLIVAVCGLFAAAGTLLPEAATTAASMPTTAEATRPADFTGTWEVRQADGSTFRGQFVRGQAHGAHTIAAADGTLRRQGFHSNGREIGAWNWWDNDGGLFMVRVMEDGRTAREIHYEGLKIVADGRFKNDMPWDGTFRDWHFRNGNKVSYHVIKEGQPWEGQFWFPFPDGPRAIDLSEAAAKPRRVTFREGKEVGAAGATSQSTVPN